MKHRIIKSATAAACLLGASWANAAIVFQDNFDSNILVDLGAGDLGWNQTPTGWTETAGGTVDIIGAGTANDLVPGNGYYIDLDGTSNKAGTIVTNTSFNFLAGITYTLSFSLAGNIRNVLSTDVAPGFDTVVAKVGSNTLSTNVWWQQPFAVYSLTFTPGANFSSGLSFQAFGADNQGPLLDNVVLSAVPVPAAVWLMGSALLGLVAVGRRRA